MTEIVHTKLEIAFEYLETAMQLYIEGKWYFSAIHLAAAAEELFGRHLPESERMSSIALRAQIGLQVSESEEQIEYAAAHDKKGAQYRKAKQIVLDQKNAIKHMNDDGGDPTVTLNPRSVARDWIEYALVNFETVRGIPEYKGRLRKSPTMQKFEACRVKENPLREF